MARIYATADDLAEWSGAPAPANAAGLLRYASSLVEGATVNALYATDAEGYPSGTFTADTFRDATTAQAAFWAANGLDPAAGSLPVLGERVATSKSIKGASVSYDAADAAQAKGARIAALETLCGEAYLILSNAGLITAAVQ